jgi:uncharacterized membrane protein
MAIPGHAFGTNTDEKNAGSARIQSIDLLRGAVMVLMAIDHVRVYSGIPAGDPSPDVFFTRWVTHFCVSAFVFLAGTSAFLYGSKLSDKSRLARYLVTRGLLLVVLELTLIRFFWVFNFDGFVLAGVIWILGWCMILLAAFVRLWPVLIGIIGLVIIAFQQVFGLLPPALPPSARESIGAVWEFFYPSGFESLFGIAVLYTLIPWIGVMMAGYGFGTIMRLEPARRWRFCLRIGLSAIALFLVAGSLLIFLQPAPPDAPPFLFRLLNQQKYPASQLFLLMTLGPVIALIPFAEKARGWFAKVLITFGSVPMFYYLLHIPLIHLSALIINFIKEGNVHDEWYVRAPFASVPYEQKWELSILYLVFFIDVTVLYFVCRWYAVYKSKNPDKKWMKYL